MSEPSEAVYAAAAEAIARQRNKDLAEQTADRDIIVMPDEYRISHDLAWAAVNAVWPFAVAEGRQEVAHASRAEAAEKRRLAADALDRERDGDTEAERHKLRFLAQAVALEQIATQIAPVTFVHPCGYSQVSPIPHLCPQCGTTKPWS